MWSLAAHPKPSAQLYGTLGREPRRPGMASPRRGGAAHARSGRSLAQNVSPHSNPPGGADADSSCAAAAGGAGTGCGGGGGAAAAAGAAAAGASSVLSAAAASSSGEAPRMSWCGGPGVRRCVAAVWVGRAVCGACGEVVSTSSHASAPGRLPRMPRTAAHLGASRISAHLGRLLGLARLDQLDGGLRLQSVETLRLKQESLVPRTQSCSRLQPVEHHLALHLRLPAGGLRGGSSKAPAAPPSAPSAPRSAAAPPTL